MQLRSPFPHDRCIHELFEEQVRRAPDAVAVVFGERRLSYRELDDQSNRLAHYLRERDIGPEGVVGLCMERGVDLVVGILGVLKAGGAYLPLDPRYPAERLGFMLEDSRARLLIGDAESRSVLSHITSVAAALIPVLYLPDLAERLIDYPSGALPSLSTADTLAYVIYTSGSTGRPKAVGAGHRSVLHRVSAQEQITPLGIDEVFCQKTAIGFVDAVAEMWVPLLKGQRLVIASRSVGEDVRLLSELIEEAGVTWLVAVPSLAKAWVGDAQSVGRLKGLRHWTLSGEALSPELLGQLKEALPSCRFVNLYGCSEVAADATCYVSGEDEREQERVPIGRPLANMQVYVLDEYLEPVPVGVAGEIYVGGVGVARGYVGQAALTAERFIANPFGEAGKRLYRTGDRARHLPNGQLQYLGRLDEQVKIRGFRIELGEIEAQLRKHKQVKEAVVIVRENQPGEQHLIGYVEPRGDDRPSAEELHMYLRSMLPEYMVPAVFVVLEHLPLTASGKVDRQSLPAPDMTAQLHAQYVSFSTPTEEVLVQIWAEVLQLEQVGVLDNFFELGGHSLLATQVMARVRESFAVELPLRTMFEASVTVRELAEKIDRSRREEQGLKLPELVARPVGMERIPLSFAQERLWFLEQLQDLGGMHNEMLPMHLEGALDVDALRRSFEELVRRHENLRTRIVTTEEGRGIQLIDPPGLFKWRVIDLSELSRQARDAEQRRLIQAEAQDSFDLTESLFRVSLLRLESDSHVLLVTLHHIISDVWSLLGVLQRELNTLYAAYSEGHPSPLAELSVQYADYALWQRSWLQGDVLQGQLEYWKQQLADMPAALELPTDRPRPAMPSFEGARVPMVVSKPLSDALNELGRREGATLYMVLLAAFQLVLSRWSGQRDVVVGSPIAGRIHRKTEGLIGLFLNNLVMRTELSGDPSFKELLVRVKEVALGAYAHQDIPFERLVAELEPQRDLSRQALFQVVLVLQNQRLTELELPKLALRSAQVEYGTAKVDLSVSFFQTEHGLSGHAEYATDLFDAATIERLAESFQQVLAAVVVDAERPISELPLLGQEQRDQLLVQWNATQRDYPHDHCIHELFEEQVRRAPDAVAVVFGERRLSYRELDDQSNRLAHYLRERDIGPEGVVGLCMERGVDLVVGILGVLKAGGAYLPLDPRYPAERLGFMLEDSRARLLIGDAESRSVLSHITSVAAALIPVLYLPDLAERLIDYPSGALPSLSTADTLAYVIYTSGSTGRPKAVGAGHRSVLHRVSAQEQITPLGIDEVFCQKTAIGFVDAVAEMWVPLLKGQRLVIASRSVGEDVRLLSELIEEAGVTWLVAVPSLAKAWVGDAQSVGRLKGLRHWTLSGEALSPELLGQLKEALPSCRFVNLYGCSEVAADATCYVSGEDEREQERVPIGRPLANMQVYVLDEYLEPVPVGVAGEIYVGGVGVARGYVGQAALTAERFIANPFGEAGKRLYRTGDRARHLPNGQLQYLGRLDEQVKIRGFRIELGEIEAQLRKHKQVKEAVVIVRENQPGEQHLIGYVEPRGDDRPSAEELHMYLRSMLPEYMVPAVFVVLEHLPLTASGKVDRQSLPAPDMTAQLHAQYVSFSTPTEEVLVQIWAEVLQLEQVGVLDNFFELGGHSLLATQVMARVRESFAVELPLRTMFEASVTVRELAEKIDRSRREEQGLKLPELVARPVGMERIPLSFAQERLWFLEQLQDLGGMHNEMLPMHLEGALDVDALRRSFEELVRRHENLRTRIVTTEEGRGIQLIDPPGLFKWRVIDLSELSRQARDAEQRRLIQAEAQDSFDLTESLFRVSLLRLESDSHVLLVTLHHIISDVWSLLGVLQRELNTLYAAYSEGHPSPLAELSVQYADYALWQRSWLQGDVLQGQLEYWKQQLADMPAALELPTDRPRPAMPSFEGARVPMVVSKPLSDALNELGRREGATLYMVLLAAFQLVLSRWSGQRDVVVGSPIAGRIHRKTEGLIGLFLNNLVMRTELSGDPSFKELLVRVKEVALGAYAHQDIPFERLVAELEPQRDLSRQALFQVVLVLQNQRLTELELPKLALRSAQVEYGTAKVDLSVSFFQTEHGLSGHAEYATDLFDAATIERLAESFQQVLAAVVVDAERPISELPLLGQEQRDQLLVQWNATQRDYPHDHCIHELFEEQVRRAPDAVAVVYEGTLLTYGELNAKANKLARYLREIGIGPDQLVGVCVERGLEMMVGLLGILKAGGAYVPLDPAYPAERLAYMLEDAATTVVLTQERLREGLPATASRVIALDSAWNEIAHQSSDNVDVKSIGLHADHLAYVIYTSGSTGRPKGVLLEHHGLCNVATLQQHVFATRTDSRVLQFASFSFDACTWEWVMALCAGARLCAASRADLIPGERLQATLDTLGITHATLPPIVLGALLPEAGSETLRTLIVAGEACPGTLVQQWAHGRQFVNAYGPTETTICASMQSCDLHEGENPPIGRPVANSRIYILDDHCEPVPIGLTGEIYIGGDGVGRGYLRQPKLTAERFMADPFATDPPARMYKTGDLGRWREDGSIEFQGRNDHQVKIRGFRIELGEIEIQLQRHAQVKEAVVIAREDVPGEKRLVAYVVIPAGEEAATMEALRLHLKGAMPEYMVPSAFIVLERLPLTASGKLNRQLLPAPNQSAYFSRQYEAPQGTVEELLANVWRVMLRVERVGRHDNFFDLGGNSMIMTQTLVLVKKVVNRHIDIVDLFKYPTISELATYCSGVSHEVIDTQHLNGRADQRRRKIKRMRETRGDAPGADAPGSVS